MKHNEIIRDLKNKVYHPIYLLMGDEPFYIDKVADYITANVLDDQEKEFNQTVVYGRDTSVQDILSIAKRFPMMANHQVLIVKEAQHLSSFMNEFLPYVENPQESTLLVLCYKYKKLDKRKAVYKAFKKNSAILESNKLRDYEVPKWIENHIKTSGLKIGPKATMLLSEHLGTDIAKIANEVEKLQVILPKGAEVTPEVIQKNIGISKDYNIFEFQKAIGGKDILKVNKIAKYFGDNEKDHPLILTLYNLYNYFSKLFIYHQLKDKSQQNVAAELKVNPFFVKEYSMAARNYNMNKLVRIIGYLKEADLKSKGINDNSTSQGELLKELVFKILH